MHLPGPNDLPKEALEAEASVRPVVGSPEKQRNQEGPIR